MNGTIELKTERLTLRRHTVDDAERLYELFGKDDKMYEYTGWNPYATLKSAEHTVGCFINSYKDDEVYSWAIEYENELIGTIGAYDGAEDREFIEVGVSVASKYWGKGFATEAVKTVTAYLVNTGYKTIKAWCAYDNIGSRRVLEKSGYVLKSTDENALNIDGRIYDRLNFEYADK
ncbi:MAG: GNAT family N-acetyltransferase [Ruminococcus sp.]|nr:GNAT family N-acetyltransferase [Ruminococcus sp.]